MRKDLGAKPYLFPQPVMIIGTYDENGKANAMNAAWGGIVGRNEIIIDLSNHKTTENLLETRAFTVSVADLEHLVPCDYVGIVSGNKEHRSSMAVNIWVRSRMSASMRKSLAKTETLI